MFSHHWISVQEILGAGVKETLADGRGALMVSRNTLAYNIGLPCWVSRSVAI